MTKQVEIMVLQNIRFDVVRDDRRRIIELTNQDFSIKRAIGGWGNTFNPRSSRPFAVKLVTPAGSLNDFLRNKAGHIRTFKDLDSSVKAFLKTR